MISWRGARATILGVSVGFQCEVWGDGDKVRELTVGERKGGLEGDGASVRVGDGCRDDYKRE